MTFFERLAERFVMPERLERMRAVLAERSTWVVPVFENMHKEHNAAAVIRTCDAFGIAEAHFIEGKKSYGIHPDVAMGAKAWVHKRNWTSTEECFRALRAEGYCIVGTRLCDDAYTPEELPLDRPLAIVFGNELAGLSPEAAAACDVFVRIPMRGFVESLNLSVAAAIILRAHSERLRATCTHGDERWRLPAPAQKKLLRRWIFFGTRVGTIVKKMRGASPRTRPSGRTASAE